MMVFSTILRAVAGFSLEERAELVVEHGLDGLHASLETKSLSLV
jgi:hypothetical protein